MGAEEEASPQPAAGLLTAARSLLIPTPPPPPPPPPAFRADAQRALSFSAALPLHYPVMAAPGDSGSVGMLPVWMGALNNKDTAHTHNVFHKGGLLSVNILVFMSVELTIKYMAFHLQMYQKIDTNQ